MMLKAKFYDGQKFLFAITMKNCNYADLRNHFTSFTYQKYRPFRVMISEIDENGEETLKADHLF